jgi:hypothetical protein
LRRTARTDLPGRRPEPGTPQVGRSRLSNRGKALAFGGTALALAGVGAATAAEITAAAPQAAGVAAATRNLSVTTAAWHDGSPVVVVPSLAHAAPAAAGAPASAAAPTGAGAPASARPAGTGAPASAVPARAGAPASVLPVSAGAPASGTPARAGAPAGAGAGSGGVQTADKVTAAKPAHVAKSGAASWQQIRDQVARDTLPHGRAGALPLADRLRPGPAQGQQTFMAISPTQLANATTIVRAALAQHMGLRSAVIAVATAMQESELQNISYGDRDSLGLFQQRPSCGWGTAQQITTPSYAARAFLTALRKHQSADPGWASQPLWASAQAVQNSGFPTAYAKWEAQAAQLVTAAVQHLVG